MNLGRLLARCTQGAVLCAFVLVGGCAKAPAPEAGDPAKAEWDSVRSPGQLDHLRDRAVLIQTDR